MTTLATLIHSMALVGLVWFIVWLVYQFVHVYVTNESNPEWIWKHPITFLYKLTLYIALSVLVTAFLK